MTRILVISFSDLARDPRVDRQIGFLRGAHEIVAAGYGPPVHADVEFIDLRVQGRPKRSELVRQARSLGSLVARRYESVYWRDPLNRVALERLTGHQADLVIANDVGALPLAFRAAAGAPVIFDAHELSTEEHGDRAWWRAIIAPYVDALLRSYLPRTAGMMTVAPGIAQRYRELYGVEPGVVTNAPPDAELRPTPVGAPIRMIHHGTADRQRRLELMIEAMDLLDDRFELDLMLVPNRSRYFARLQRLAAARPRVRLVEPLPQREIVAACNAYDIGVYLLPPRNENLRHALPNKLFEFIQARLAIAVGPSPAMAQIVHDHDCGVVASDFTPAALAEVLHDLDPERISAYKQRAHRAAASLSGERNRGTVLTLVERALAD